MRFIDLLGWVRTALLAQRLRAGLTIAGFAIGMAAVVLMTSIGESLRLYVLQEFTQFGSHIIAVTPGKDQTFGLGGLLKTVRPLTLTDSQTLSRQKHIKFTVPVIAGNAKVKAGQRGRYTNVFGVNQHALNAWKLSLAQGMFLPSDELTSARNLAVLGAKLKQELFANASPLGKFIHVGSERFKVVGVLAEKGQFLGQDLDDTVYIPASTAMTLFNRNSLMEIDIFYHSGVSTQLLVTQIKRHLIHIHGREDFTIITQDDMLNSLDKILAIIKLAGAGLGIISLLVGAVGIATIMTIAVTERTAEIGLLRALGLTAKQLKILFLAEAIFLALVSGILGYLLALLLLFSGKLWLSAMPLELDLRVLFFTLLVSALIGLICGIAPAYKAAKLPPILALRTE